MALTSNGVVMEGRFSRAEGQWRETEAAAGAVYSAHCWHEDECVKGLLGYVWELKGTLFSR